MEQFLQSFVKSLQMYLRERLPLKLSNIVELAESYVQAHGGLLYDTNNFSGGHDEKPDTPGEPVKDSKNKDSSFKDSSSKPKPSRSFKCFSCGQIGHRASDCRVGSKGKKTEHVGVGRSKSSGIRSMRSGQDSGMWGIRWKF